MITNSGISYQALNQGVAQTCDFASQQMKAIYAYCNPFAQGDTPLSKIRRFHIEPSFGPAVWQILYPPELIRACFSLMEASKIQNSELINDIKLNLLRILAGSAYSAAYLFALSIEVGMILSKVIVPIAIAPFAPIVGIAGAGVCAFIEGKKAIRQHRFIAECRQHIKALKLGRATPEVLAFLKEFMPTENSLETDQNFTKLADRVRPWFFEEFAEEIETRLPKLIDRLEKPTNEKSRAKWNARAIRFIEHVKTQAEKKRLLQIVSVAAIALLTLSFIAAIMAQPHLIPILIIGAYFAILITNYVHDAGTKNHLSWDFKPDECIPNFAKKFMGMQTKPAPTSVFRKKYKVLTEDEKISLQRFKRGTLRTSRKLSRRILTVGKTGPLKHGSSL